MDESQKYKVQLYKLLMQYSLFDESFVYNIVSEPKIVYETTIPYSQRMHAIKSVEAEKIFRKFWSNDIELIESFYVMYCNNKYNTLAIKKINTGSAQDVSIDLQSILRYAILLNAQTIFLAHNHPSGDTIQSKSDELLTESINKACLFHNIRIIDHLILTKETYLSFADEGIL